MLYFFCLAANVRNYGHLAPRCRTIASCGIIKLLSHYLKPMQFITKGFLAGININLSLPSWIAKRNLRYHGLYFFLCSRLLQHILRTPNYAILSSVIQRPANVWIISVLYTNICLYLKINLMCPSFGFYSPFFALGLSNDCL